ncbi:MAG TPA: alpha/beta hydrolase [Bacteroidales bacterium]|nr:alpha/beta hydrolase [Bacteroidales bacterium]
MKKLFFSILITLFVSSVFALNPKREYIARPGDFGLEYEEVTILTSDNLNLKGWLYKPQTPSFKMIILSGSGDGNMGDLIEIASNFVTLGYNVLTYDYRGYGESENFNINNNFYIYAQFEKDLNAAIDYARKYHSKMKILDLWGKEVGAGLSIAVGCNRKEIFQVIADSPYSTLEDIKKKFKDVAGKEVLLPLGFNKYMIEPYYALESKGTSLYGVMLIAGENETIYSEADIKSLGKIRKDRTTVNIVKGATSSETFTKDKNKYFENIRGFLKEPF